MEIEWPDLFLVDIQRMWRGSEPRVCPSPTLPGNKRAGKVSVWVSVSVNGVMYKTWPVEEVFLWIRKTIRATMGRLING